MRINIGNWNFSFFGNRLLTIIKGWKEFDGYNYWGKDSYGWYIWWETKLRWKK